MPTICLALLLAVGGQHHLAPSWRQTCVDVAQAADTADISPALTLAVAYRESRLDGAATGAAGELGPMQVMRYHDRRAEGYTLAESGALKLAGDLEECDTTVEALCRYKGGPCRDCDAGRTRAALTGRIALADWLLSWFLGPWGRL